VGAFFNVTRERIRQIEAKALRKLRHPDEEQEAQGVHRAALTRRGGTRSGAGRPGLTGARERSVRARTERGRSSGRGRARRH
jgi:hypothetical protein